MAKKQKKQIHSRAYHRYFEGYEEIVIDDPKDGTPRIQRHYAGDYYIPKLTDGERIIRKLAYCILFLAAVLLFFTAASREAGLNSVWYVVVPSCMSFFFFVLHMISLVWNLMAPKRMEIRVYRDSHEKFLNTSALSALALLLTAAGSIIYVVIASKISYNIHIILMQLLASALMLGAYILEKSVRFDVEIQENAHVPKAATIRYYSDLK